MKKLIALLLAITMCVGLFAGCAKKNEDLTKAKEYLYSLYVDKSTVTPSDLEYPAKVKGGSTFFDVEWTVEIISGTGEVKVVASENDGFVVVDVPEEPAEDIVYKLTATIKDAEGKQTETLTFEYTVPKFTVDTFAEYVAAKTGDAVVTQGVVTGLIAKSQGASYNCIYYQDADGGYYAYGLTEDPITDLKLEVGMTIRVTGTKDVYNGTHEVKDVTVKIISSDKSEVVATDFTERFQNAADLKAEELVYQQALLVTIKGVEITGQDPSNGYYKFKLGELESYIRISGSTCPLNADEKAALIAGHSEHMGWIANVTGVICVYSGAFYLTPVSADAFEYISLPEKTDAEKVEFEKGNLEFPGIIDENTEIELPAAGQTYTEVTIAWAVEGEGAEIVDGKLVITMPKANTTVKLIATVTCGEATSEAVFEILLLATELSYEEIVNMAYALQPGASLPVKMTLMGVITSVDTAWSEQYSNITVTIQVGDMADKLIMCFRLKGDGAKDLKVGDTITVEGTLKNYNGTIEFDAGCQLIAVESGSGNEGGNEGGNEQPDNGDTDGMALTIKEAIERCNKAGDTPTTIKYKLTGKVIEIKNDTYGNLIIEDATGSILIYGCYSADGKDRYDAMDNFPQVGDTITVYGVLMSYQGKTPQMKNAWCLSGGTGKQEAGNDDNKEENKNEDTDGMELTIEEAIERCNKAGDTPTEIKYKLTGKVIEIRDETWGNMVIEDATGSILLYGCYSADGKDRYDVMDNFPQVGDTITVYGVLMSYQGKTPQMKNAWCLSGGTGKHEAAGDDNNDNGDASAKPIDGAPEVGVAYKFGMVQENVSTSEVYYLAGGMNGYYMATTTDASAAIDIYLEEAEGGYYLYTMERDTKVYINMVVSADGQHVNGAYESTASTVYTWDSESKTMVANVDGVQYWFGTRNDKQYTTIGPCKTSYNGFYCMFYAD